MDRSSLGLQVNFLKIFWARKASKSVSGCEVFQKLTPRNGGVGWGGVAGSAAGRQGRETLNSGHPSHWGSQEAAQNQSVRDTHPPRDESIEAFRHQLLKVIGAGSS